MYTEPIQFTAKSSLAAVFDVGYILSPIVGFLPQIYTRNITYNPIMSLLTIVANLLKIFSRGSGETDTIMLYQFAVCTLLHLLLLTARLKQLKSPAATDMPYPNALTRIKHLNQWIVAGVAGLILLLRMLDAAGVAVFFMEIAVAIEIMIALLHIKYYRGASKPIELFAVWILGDAIKMYLMYRRYECPVACYMGALAQIGVNLYVLLS